MTIDNKWHAFYEITLPVYLRDYLSKVDLKLNSWVKGFSCKSISMHSIRDYVCFYR